MDISTSNSKCRICGSSFTSRTIGRIINGFSLSECGCCGTIITETQPPLCDLKETYNVLFAEGGYSQHRADHERLKSGKHPSHNYYRQNLLSRAEKICTGRTLFEIGGGTGGFGVLAKSRGWVYTNYDISETAVHFCKELSLDAHKFELGTYPPLASKSADVVVAWEVIEHVWNLNEYLEAIRNALKPGGIFLFSTPNWLTPTYQNSDEWGVLGAPPIHINFFTVESLMKTLKASKFNSVSIKKRCLYRPLLQFRSIIKSLRFALFLDEAETLMGMAGESLIPKHNSK